MGRKHAGILIFHYVEILDFCGPYEVFTATRLDEEHRMEEPPPFTVSTIAESDDVITTAGGLRVIPDHTFQSCPPMDILVVPGGGGVRVEIENSKLIDWIAERAKEVETLTSVCTGAMLLGRAGLLDGRRATTHWRSLDWMSESFPNVTVERELHVVEDGNVITSAGISAGIDMALKVVERYYGKEVARATARNMEYGYPDDNARRI